MPYVVTNQEQANKFFSPGGFMWETIDSILNEQNVKVIAFTDLGFYEVVNNKRPIRQPADCKGIKIRIMRYKSQEVLYNAFGISGIPMDFGDAVTALQSGVIDGEGCNGAMVHALYLKGLFKYVTPLYHFYESATLMMNLKMFEDLPPEYRKVIEEEGVNLSNKQKAWLATAEADFHKQMEKEGARVETLTPEELKVFEELGRGTWPQLEELIGKDLMVQLKAAAE
jgi:C4-dicarboxylate-binding protein DctP